MFQHKKLCKKVFLTGKPGVGKTTVVEKVTSILRSKGFKVGGMVTFEVKEAGVRKGFMVTDILTGRKGILAWVGNSEPKIGKYSVNIKDLEEVGVNAIKVALNDADIIVVDEIGPMEFLSSKFRDIVKTLINAYKPVTGVVHYRFKDLLFKDVKGTSSIEIFEVSVDNRESLAGKVVDALLLKTNLT